MKQFLAVNKSGSKCWAKSGVMPLLVDKKKLGFKAIAVVAGLTSEEKLLQSQ